MILRLRVSFGFIQTIYNGIPLRHISSMSLSTRYRMRKSLLLAFLSLFCLFQLMFVTMWSPSSLHRSSRILAKRTINPKVEPFFHGTHLNDFPTTEAKKTRGRNEENIYGWTIRRTLAPYVNESLGRVLNVEFSQKEAATNEANSQDVLDIVFQRPPFPKGVDETKVNSVQNTRGATKTRFVYVYYRYWEQLTMNTRILINLAAQAKIGGRRVVEPMVRDSSFGSEGEPLRIYFDVDHMNKILATGGFATLAGKKDYDEECSLSAASHATLHFLYDQDKAEIFTKQKFGLSDEEYKKITKMAKEKGWTECTFLEKSLKLKPGSKKVCVDPTIITDWSVLERDVLKGVKCLGIVLWRGIGGGTRSFFSEKHIEIPSKVVQFSLKQSPGILSEVTRFKKTHLAEQYIAVQVRGEKVVIPHNLKRMKKCLYLLINVIQVLKELFGIKKVFVATDMSSYGSGSWGGSLRGEIYDNNTLIDLHNNLISTIGAVVYTPAAGQQNQDRGTVSLVEMAVIAQAQYLVTIGSGSFQEWIVANFLKFHRGNTQAMWSLTRMCLKE